MIDPISVLLQISSNFISVLSATWFSTAIALVGGFLGILSFLMQLPKQLKPIVVQHGDVDFLVEERGVDSRKWTELAGLEFSMTFSNSKRAFGIVEDVFCRVYTSDSFSPDAAVYYAATVDKRTSNFEPIVLGPEAKISLQISFSEIENRRSNKVIDLQKNYIVDVFYKLRGKTRPIQLPSIHTGTFNVIDRNRIRLKNITRLVSRGKYENRLTPLTNSTYKGVVGFNLSLLLSKTKYYLIIQPTNYFLGFFEMAWTIPRIALTWLVERLWTRPLIIQGAKKIRSFRVTMGDTSDRKLTEKRLAKIALHVKSVVDAINKGLATENQIKQKIDNHKIELERFEKKLRVYASGDSTITVDDEQTENAISFTFGLKRSKWGIRVLSNNGKIISTHNAAMLIMNDFGLYSLYRK